MYRRELGRGIRGEGRYNIESKKGLLELSKETLLTYHMKSPRLILA
jgi:hypothetical protein